MGLVWIREFVWGFGMGGRFSRVAKFKENIMFVGWLVK